MPPVQPPRKPHYYYPHEEFFFWALVLVTFMLALNYGGVAFILTIVLGFSTGLVFVIFVPWYLWREYGNQSDH